MSLMRRVWSFLRGHPFQPEGRELREYKRILVRFTIAFAGGQKKGRGIARDLSLGGCMMETDTPMPVDTLLELKLFVTEQEMPIEVAASVRWADGQRIGIKFLRIRDQDRFRKFLS
jgi:hypothetical protein